MKYDPRDWDWHLLAEMGALALALLTAVFVAMLFLGVAE